MPSAGFRGKVACAVYRRVLCPSTPRWRARCTSSISRSATSARTLRPHHTLFQTSTIDALLEGKYDGDVSFAELEDRGDFGLGTLDALDGEMIALDGDFYQVKADGRAYPVGKQLRTPFAVVTFFEPNLSRMLATPMDFEALGAYLDRLVGGETSCYAVRVDGRFDYVKTRSVPRQRKPYPPLAEVVESQPTFELHDVREASLASVSLSMPRGSTSQATTSTS